MALPERPEPMNVITHHSKVKVSVSVPDPTFVAGKYVSGKMEMECRADKGLGIGVIMIELFGIQELSSRDHSATCTFLHAQRLFQGPGLPPSNAVQAYAEPGDPLLPSHHYHARRGISTFLFRIPLPISSPSSVNFGAGLATVKYELRASAGVHWRGEKRLVTERKIIDVVEGLDDVALVEYASGGDATSITVGENGKLWMQGCIIGGAVVTAGECACVELQVKNHSSKTNTGLSLTLTRRLVISSVEKQPLQISDTLINVAFRGPEYIIHPGVEGVANLVFDMPKTARGVKGGVYKDEGDDNLRETQSIFEVQCIVGVKMNMGIGSKDLVLSIPVTIVSPLALPDEPMDFPQEYVSQATPAELFPCSMPTLYPDPNAYTPYSMPASSPPPTALSPLPMFAAYTGQNQVWLPPPSQSPFSYQYVSPVYSMYSQTTSPLVQQNLPPPRPASALATSLPYSYPEPAISGLPPSAVQHPLLPLNLTAHYESRPAQQPDLNHLEPEEGKGERASRVAHRLRMSSRHRSVSPQSHRFPLPQSSPRGANVSTEMSVNAEDLLLPPLPPPIFLSSAQAEAGDTVPVPMTDENEQVSCSPQPPLYFPRPMLSPKMSNGSLPRSDRVEELERIAAEVEDEVHSQKSSKTKSKRSKGKSKQRRTINSRTDINKTLPPPPVPTCKGYLSPDVSDYFNLQCSKPEQDIAGLSEIPPTPIPVPLDKAPPTPTLTAVTPVRHVRSNLTEKLAAGRVESGLDALERRLLAEVGTQKIERVFSSSGDVRNLFSGPSNAQTIQSKALSPSKIPEDASQPTKGRLSPIKIPPPRIGGDAGSDGLNIDSAISSLTLADGGWVMEADRRAREKEAEQGQDHVVEESATHEAHEERDSDEKTHRAGTVGGKSKSKSSFSGDDVREERKQLKKRHRRHAADELVVDSEREDGADSRGRSREGSVKGKKSGRKKECHKRRKSVKGRVTAWLGTIDPDAVPLEENFVGASHMDLGAAEQRSGMIGGDIDATGRTRQSEPERAATGANLSRSPTLPPPHVEPPQVDVPTSAPNPRSSGFMPMTTEKLETRRMSRHMMTTSERRHPNVKHDLKNIFAPMTCFDASTPTPEVREDLGLPTRPRTASGVVQISPSSPRPQSTSISAGRGDKSNVEDNLSAVKAPMGGLFKASLTTTMSRDISVQPSAQPLLRAPVPILAKQCQDPEIKYDVRSARGGRGGQVTAIAAFWAAAAAKEASTPGSSTPTKGSSPDVRSRRQAPSVVAPKPVMAQRVNKPLIANERRDNQPYKVAMTGKPLPVDTHKSPSPTTLNESSPKLLGLAGKTKPGTKSPSVPAVISSSLAIPMLSSTASLARPPTQQSRRPLVTPITNNLISAAEPPKCHSPTKARSTPDLAFGKARLRDLIKKYQEQGS